MRYTNPRTHSTIWGPVPPGGEPPPALSKKLNSKKVAGLRSTVSRHPVHLLLPVVALFSRDRCMLNGSVVVNYLVSEIVFAGHVATQ